MNPFPPQRRPAWLLPFLLYAGLGLAGLHAVVIAGQVSPVWPASGAAIWALLRFGRRSWPAILAAATVVALTTGATPAVALGIGVGNTLEPLLAVALLGRFGFDPSLARTRDVFLLLAAAAAAPLVSACCGAGSLLLGGIVGAGAAGRMAWVWWLGNFMGVMAFAPLLLALAGAPRRPRRWRPADALAVALAALLVAALGLLRVVPEAHLYSQAFLLFPIAVLASLRFGPPGAAVASAAISFVTIAATTHGLGPFADRVAVEGVIVLQLFLALLTLTSLLLAASAAERESAMEQAEHLAAAMRATQEAVVITDASRGGRILWVNDAACRMTGWRVEQLLGEPAERFDGEPNPQLRDALGAAVAESRPFLAPWTLRRADGTHFAAELQLSPVRGPKGRAERFVLTFRDVSERQVMEARLILSERMASMGALAAGVGHEINNPLAFVLTNLEVLEREVTRAPFDPAVREGLHERIRDARFGAERVRTIVRDLRVFGRDEADARQAVDVNATLESALGLAASQLRGKASVRRRYGAPPPVWSNQARLGQVFLNLLVNAAQALPDGEPDNEIEVRTDADEAGRARIEILDNGCGIAPGDLAKVFQLFFTTKPLGVGSGLGLPICKRIVEDHGGSIEVENRPGGGARVRVVLPPAPAEAVRAEPAPAPAPAPVPRRPGAPPRLLVVDDEVRLARSLRPLLEPEYEVAFAGSGREALARLSGGERFDVLLCDLHMPDVSGMELHARLAELAPDQAERIIFFSGGAYSEQARSFLATVTNPVLDKPVRPGRLTEALEAFLRREPERRAAGGGERA